MLRVLTAAAFLAAAAPGLALAGTVSFSGEYVLADELLFDPCLEERIDCRSQGFADASAPVVATVAFTVTEEIVAGGGSVIPFDATTPPGLLAFEFVLQGGGPSDGTYTLGDVTGLVFTTEGPLDLSQDLIGQLAFLDFNFFTDGPVTGVAPNRVGVGGGGALIVQGFSAGLLEPYEIELSSLRATSSPVPVPAAGLMLAPAALALVALRRRRRSA
jgi:MYXO-CTERM domain-containing protein